MISKLNELLGYPIEFVNKVLIALIHDDLRHEAEAEDAVCICN